MKQGSEKELEDVFRKRVVAYNQVFVPGPHTLAVLSDLARFCRAHESTFHADPRVHAALEGRREVWLRIQESLQLTTEQVYELHKIKGVTK